MIETARRLQNARSHQQLLSGFEKQKQDLADELALIEDMLQSDKRKASLWLNAIEPCFSEDARPS